MILTLREAARVKARSFAPHMHRTRLISSWIYLGKERDEPSFIAETSFIKAPLNSRVGTNNVTPKGKGKAKQASLDRVPLEIQEALVLEDLLYVLMVRDDSNIA